MRMNLISKSILAGIAISIGCMAYLTVGGITGAFLFSFGLLTIIYFNWSLYTGKAGYLFYKDCFKLSYVGIGELCLTYIGNIIGVAIAYLMSVKTYNIQPLLDVRMSYTWYQTLFASIFCGFIMTAAVFSNKNTGKLAILILGIPIFIMCGFLHCIADFFYYMYKPEYLIESPNYAISVIGNLIGCNLWRLTFLNFN